MSTVFMFGKYSIESLKEMSAERTKKIISLVEKCNGKVNSMHAILGEYDLIFITEFPNIEQAMKASVGLTKLTGIAFSTSPAVSVAEFDKLTAEI
jgi:uncharacterized protein with GYD domain